MRFLNKVVLITGSSRGLGKRLVIDFVREGAHVIINYNRSKKEALELQKKIEDEGYNVDVIKADVSVEEDVKKMIDTIVSKYNAIDIIINNAAISNDSLIEEKDKESFNKILDVNLIGTFLVTKYATKYLSEDANIINISSTDGIDTNYIYGMEYDASKAGIISLSSNFAKELAPIRVNTICPGWIDTDMNKDMDDSFRKMEEDKILLKRFASVEEISKVCLFVASRDASYINNSVIRVDGGKR